MKKGWYVTRTGILHTGLRVTYDGWKARCNRKLKTISSNPIPDNEHDKFMRCIQCVKKTAQQKDSSVSRN